MPIPRAFSHDFLPRDPLLQWLNDCFTEEATKSDALDWVSLLKVPQHASARSTKNPRCHGADGQGAKGQLGLEGAVDSCHKSEPQLGALPPRVAQPEALTRCTPTAWPPGPWN